MKYIDLHVHTNASDGTLSPSAVAALAAETGLAAIAVTDHDTLCGIPEATAAANGLPLEIIPGIELSCAYQNTEIHILGLYIDQNDPDFITETNKLLELRDARNEEIIRRFKKGGMEFSIEELTAGNPNTVITRAHFARALVEKGYAATMTQAFKKYLQYGNSYCPRKETVTPEHAMKILTSNRAFPVIAHPCQYKLGDAGTETLVAYLKELGLKGVEVYHSSHNQYESGKLKDLARKYKLLPTGGSDFHGDNKPDIQIGSGRGGLRISYALLTDIRAAL